MLGIDGKYPAGLIKKQIITVLLEHCEIWPAKHFIEKAILLNYVNLSTISYPRLQISCRSIDEFKIAKKNWQSFLNLENSCNTKKLKNLINIMNIGKNIFSFQIYFFESSSKLNPLKNWVYLLLLNNQTVLGLFLDIIAEAYNSLLDVLQEVRLVTEDS